MPANSAPRWVPAWLSGGSRDRFLGIPVAWSDISEARVIVEVDLPDFQVESSQGSHFFQNLTSFQIGAEVMRSLGGQPSEGYVAKAAPARISLTA